MRLALLVFGLALAMPSLALAAPSGDDAEVQEAARISGRVHAAGTRALIAGAQVIVVDAPADVRVGARAQTPLDPEHVSWIRETVTDEDGRFELGEVPVTKVRIVVLAAGYERLEMWAESTPDAEPLNLYLRPSADASGQYRTEVVTDRNPELPRAEHQVDGQRARSYPGSGGDPVRAVQNLPGVARAPGGLGLVAVRGGDPRQTGIYVDGHPVPRGFHVLPIAAVVDPSMIDHVDLTPGNFDAAYGGVSGGLLEIHTRRLEGVTGVHGEAHVDLFDTGGAARAPVGPGGVGFAFRRAHVGDVIKLADGVLGKTGILVPNYWDYIGRFDMPVRARHHLSIKAFGAGDALQDTTQFEAGNEVTINFRTAFHRFDLGYAFDGPRLHASLSGALLLDTNTKVNGGRTQNRSGRTLSLRGAVSHRLSSRATLLAGADVVHTHAFRQWISSLNDDVSEYESNQWRLGTWLGVAFSLATKTGLVVLRPQVRLNVFGTATEQRVMPDPRFDLRARVHRRIELFAALGQYSAPLTVFREGQLGLISSSDSSTSHVVIPDWLVSYFDPGDQTETPDGFLLVTRTMQASLGTQVELPWSVGLRATVFWRESPSQVRGWQPFPTDHGFLNLNFDETIRSPAGRAYGLELLVDRSLAPGVHGMLGYTLLRAETTEAEYEFYEFVAPDARQVPSNFDQRHNLVALLVFELPRDYRFGARFRLVSGNPEQPVIGTIVTQEAEGFRYKPIYGEFGSSYGPLFHQLDLRLDKTWYLRRTSVVGYLDVQNVYNRLYPEIWIYSADWSQRGERIGIPIFPSLGVRVEF